MAPAGAPNNPPRQPLEVHPRSTLEQRLGAHGVGMHRTYDDADPRAGYRVRAEDAVRIVVIPGEEAADLAGIEAGERCGRGR